MSGHFQRTVWYQPGIEHGNPKYNTRFRVNAPEASLHPDFMHRPEVRGNGMMQILMEGRSVIYALASSGWLKKRSTTLRKRSTSLHIHGYSM